ncbi:TRAP transporter substrate-binding protein DctP [Thalassobaculum sp.]|uniref:TRAP transporter substrate-binding protein DctP n=1 Tax=Thalassobaculum sp. TaxID=2022740 RepID=UPI0032EFB9D4
MVPIKLEYFRIIWLSLIIILSFSFVVRANSSDSERLSIAGSAFNNNVAVKLLEKINISSEMSSEDLSVTYVDVPEFDVEKLIDYVMSGKYDIGIVSIEELIKKFEEKNLVYLSLLAQPFTYANNGEMFRVQDSIYGDIVLSEIGKFGVIPLGFWNHPQSHLVTKKHIENVEDLKGLKIATPQKYSYSTIFALGASPVAMSFSEVYGALQTGVVDGIEQYSYKSYDVPDVVFYSGSIITNYRSETGIFIVSVNSWKRWTESKRSIVRSAIKDTEKVFRGEILQSEEKLESLVAAMGIRFENLHALDGTEKARKFSQERWVRRVGDVGFRAIELMNRAIDGELPSSIQVDEHEPRRGDASEAAVYFATDRSDSQMSDLSERFGVDRSSAPEVSCGEIVFDNDKIRKVGSEFAGNLWIDSIHGVSKDKSCVQLLSDISKLQSGKLVIFIHGYWNTFESSARRAVGVAEDLGITDRLVLWSWPSLGVRGGYFYDEESVEWSSVNFQEFLGLLLKRSEVDSVDLIAHSMGNRIILKSLLLNLPEATKIQNIVFVAPDVASDVFLSAINRYKSSGALRTLYASQNDRALLVSKYIHSAARAGIGGESIIIAGGLDSVDATLVEKVWGVNHNHALQIPEAVGDLRSLLSSLKSASQRGLMRGERDGLSFWLIQPRN